MTDKAQEAEGSAPRGRGAPEGNQNGTIQHKMWRRTIQRAIAQHASADVLREIADALIESARGGDLGAIKELGDRLDGKVAQQVMLTGDEEGGPVKIERIKRVIVDTRGP